MPLWDYAAIHLIGIAFGVRRQYLFPQKVYYASTVHKGILLRAEGVSGWLQPCSSSCSAGSSPDPSCCSAQPFLSPLTPQKGFFGRFLPSPRTVLLCLFLTQSGTAHPASPAWFSPSLASPSLSPITPKHQAQCLGTMRRIAATCWSHWMHPAEETPSARCFHTQMSLSTYKPTGAQRICKSVRLSNWRMRRVKKIPTPPTMGLWLKSPCTHPPGRAARVHVLSAHACR